MRTALRPYVTTGIALVGASVMVAAPITVKSQELRPVVSSVDVMPAASVQQFVTGLLADFNTVSVAGGNAAQIGIDAIAGLPLGLSLAAQAIITDPSVTPDVLNYLIQSFLSPIPGSGSVFEQFGTEVIAPLVGLLPVQLQAVVGSALIDLGTALGTGLAQLPGNPLLGGAAIYAAMADLPSGIFNLTSDIKTLGEAIGQSIGGGYVPGPGLLPTTGLAGWLGFTPTVLAATLQAAVDDPSAIPGLASYLAYTLLAPPSAVFPPPMSPIPPNFPGIPYPVGSYSLFVTTFAPIIAALEEVLPAPHADALESVSAVLNEVIVGGLDLLPTPINPFTLITPLSTAKVPGKDVEASVLAQLQAPADAPLTPAEAFEVSAKLVLGDLQGLPAGVEQLVTAVKAGYLTVPDAINTLASGLLTSSQEALAPIVGSLIALDPPIGGPTGIAVKGATALGDVVEDIQEHLQPTAPSSDKVTLADGQEKTGDERGKAKASSGSLVHLKLPKPKLNVPKLNVLDVKDQKALGEATEGETEKASSRPLSGIASHLPAPGKISVKELTKKLGLDKLTADRDVDNDKNNGDTDDPAE